MLENYFIRPETVDRIRASWIGGPIEQYVTWLDCQGYAARTVYRRVPLLVRFGAFAAERGARCWDDLPAHVDAFVADCVTQREADRTTEGQRRMRNFVRPVVEQMVALAVPGWDKANHRPSLPDPFCDPAPGFFIYLRDERGLRETSIHHYRHFLRRFEGYLGRIGCADLSSLSPPVLSGFIVETAGDGFSPSTMTGLCSALRVFLRYLRRQGTLARNLARCVEPPQSYRMADLPRSIGWDDVRRMLETVERRTPVGRRDYAILLLLVTYGLRAREVAALRLDDIDWKRERLLVPERKADHTTAYPLSSIVGEAILDYLQHGRPETEDRQLFFRHLAPHRPLTFEAVSSRASHYLRRAGVQVRRPGSHTLRHTCVQRLVDADFPFKTIGDYVGHRSASSTEIYAKVAIGSLRDVALGDGEALP